MALAIDYTINLVDKLSAPAATAASSLNKVGRAMRDTREKLAALHQRQLSQNAVMASTAAKLDELTAKEGRGSVAVEKLTQSLNKQADAARATANQIRGTNEKLKDLSEASGKPPGKSLAMMAGDALKLLGPLALASVSFKALSGVASAAFEGRGHKLQVMGQLESMTQSGDKAKELYGHMQLISKELGISQGRVEEVGMDLMKSRMPATSLEGTIKTITALEAGQGPEAAAKLQALVKGSAFKKSFGLTREDAMALGTNMNEVYTEIAKNTRQGVDDVRQQMMYGQVTARDGLDALNSLLTRKNKTALDIAKMDPAKMFDKFKETLTNLFEDVDLTPVSEALGLVTKMFDRTTVTGKSFKMLMDGVVKLVGWGIKEIVPVIGAVIDYVTLAGLKIYLALIPTFGTIRRVMKALHLDGGTFGDMMINKFGAVLKIIEGLGKALAIVGSGVEVGVRLLSGKDAGAAGDKLGSQVYEALHPKEGMFGAGASIVDGLSGGMLSKVGLIEKTSETVAQAVPNTVAKKLDMHSPSRVLVAQGKMAGDSLAIGLDKSEGPAALDGLGKQTGGATSATPVARGGATAGAATGATYNFGDFIFNGVATGADPQEIARSVYVQFTEQLEQLATQLGQPVGFGV
jgi:hypothetical protein